MLPKGKADASQLDSSSFDEVVSLLASIQAAVNGIDDERLIRTREACIGSHFMIRACRSPSQIHEQEAIGHKVPRMQRPGSIAATGSAALEEDRQSAGDSGLDGHRSLLYPGAVATSGPSRLRRVKSPWSGT
ncbi:MAG: hypothetical protein ACREO7_02340 [Pseudoxanthomonas sp.]